MGVIGNKSQLNMNSNKSPITQWVAIGNEVLHYGGIQAEAMPGIFHKEFPAWTEQELLEFINPVSITNITWWRKNFIFIYTKLIAIHPPKCSEFGKLEPIVLRFKSNQLRSFLRNHKTSPSKTVFKYELTQTVSLHRLWKLSAQVC